MTMEVVISMIKLTKTFRLDTTPTFMFQTRPLGAANQTIAIVTGKCDDIANKIRCTTFVTILRDIKVRTSLRKIFIESSMDFDFTQKENSVTLNLGGFE